MNASKTPFLSLLALLACSAALAQNVSGPTNVQLTVYNNDFALVKETRTVHLGQGLTSLSVTDVASRIDPTSVLFKSLTAPNAVTILEQNYQFDLMSPNSILQKAIGQHLTFTRFDDQGQPHKLVGVLLNSPDNSGGAVVRADDGSLMLAPWGQISVDKMPAGLKSKPTLNWLVSSDRPGDHKAVVSYITNGAGWRADYVALVNKDDSKLDLTGWVTLTNNCGATYKNADLTLMAGDVRRVTPEVTGGFALKAVNLARDEKASQFQEKSFFEYHMYKMTRPTTIADKETKQLSLLSASNASVDKEMIYDGRGAWFRNWWYPGRRGDWNPGAGYDTSNYHKVNVVLVVNNSKANHMGMPLPKGKVRVYKLDDKGAQQFVGEDNIDHTPKDEKIRLHVGDAFDVVGDYKRTDFKKIASDVIEESFEVKIRNHKDKAVKVRVVDHVWSDWQVVSSSDKYVKKDATTIEFPVTVAPDKEKIVTYRIRIQY